MRGLYNFDTNPIDLSFTILSNSRKFYCSKNIHIYLLTSLLDWWGKVIYPKYSKHWPYTVAHIIVCSKKLNHSELNKFRMKETRLLYCFRSQIFTWNTSYSARNQPFLICPNGCAEQLFSNVYSMYLGCITLWWGLIFCFLFVLIWLSTCGCQID